MELDPLLEQRPHPSMVDERYHVFDLPNMLNIVYWQDVFQHIKYLDYKNIVEFGVGRGRSLLSLIALEIYTAGGVRMPASIFAFDSFEGFPEPTLLDESYRKAKKGEWSHSPSGKFQYSPEFIQEVLDRAGVPTNFPVNFIKGFFENTCPAMKSQVKEIGLMHLDADLYESTRAPLSFFANNIIQGGVIVIDDFRIDDQTDAWPGCRKAVTEFLEERSDFEAKKTLRGTPLLVKI